MICDMHLIGKSDVQRLRPTDALARLQGVSSSSSSPRRLPPFREELDNNRSSAGASVRWSRRPSHTSASRSTLPTTSDGRFRCRLSSPRYRHRARTEHRAWTC